MHTLIGVCMHVKRLHNRFRTEVQDDNKPLWERKGGGIVPLQLDTSPIKNIQDHKYVPIPSTCMYPFALLAYHGMKCCGV